MASPEEAQKLVAALGLGPDIAQALTEFPTKGLGPVVPTDPVIYRFGGTKIVPLESMSRWLLATQSGH
jgi:cyanate lyase